MYWASWPQVLGFTLTDLLAHLAIYWSPASNFKGIAIPMLLCDDDVTRPSSDSEGLGTRLGSFIKKDHLASFWKEFRYYKIEKVKTPVVTRSQIQDIWLVQPVLCHWATTTTSTHIAHNNDKWSLCRFATARLHFAECHLLVCAGVFRVVGCLRAFDASAHCAWPPQ